MGGLYRIPLERAWSRETGRGASGPRGAGDRGPQPAGHNGPSGSGWFVPLNDTRKDTHFRQRQNPPSTTLGAERAAGSPEHPQHPGVSLAGPRGTESRARVYTASGRDFSSTLTHTARGRLAEARTAKLEFKSTPGPHRDLGLDWGACRRSTWGATSRSCGTSGGFPLEAVQESQLCSPPPTNRVGGALLCLPRGGHADMPPHKAGSAAPIAANHCCLPKRRLGLPRSQSQAEQIRAGTPGSWSPHPAPPCCGEGGRITVRGRPVHAQQSSRGHRRGACCHHGE